MATDAHGFSQEHPLRHDLTQTSYPPEHNPDPRTHGHPPQPASIWLAILFLLTLALGWVLIQVQFNPSNGARGDFERYHYVTIEMFRDLPFAQFIMKMNAASGPLFYMVAGWLPLDATGTRLLTVVLYAATAVILARLSSLNNAGGPASLMMAVALLVSPFQLGTALWGHPETFALFLIAASTALNQHHIARWLLPLTVAVRQTAIACVAASALQDLMTPGRRVSALIKVLVSTLIISWLLWAWGGLTPPAFQYYSRPSSRSFMVSMALMTLAIHGFNLRPSRPFQGSTALRVFLGAGITLAIYLPGPDFGGGGFIFSRLDSLSTQRGLPCVLSPLLIGTVLGLYAPQLMRAPSGTAAMVMCSAVSAASNILYLKYVDFSIWSLVLIGMFTHGLPRDAQLRTAMSLLAWSTLNMSLALVVY